MRPPRDQHWYSRFGIEEPFPWPPFVAVGVVLALLVGGVWLGIVAF